MDEGDRAKAAAEIIHSDALADHQHRMAAGNSRPALTECQDCEEPIPEDRRKAAPNCIRCIDCQTNFEGNR